MSANVAGLLKNSTSLRATIFGFQRQFRQGFGLKRFVWSVHNNPKQGIRATNNQSTDYPYGWFKLPTMAFNREESVNIKNIARHGSGWAIGSDGTNAVVVTNYYFPITLTGSLYLKFMNIDQALLCVQQLMVAGLTDLMSFSIEMPTAKWTVRVKIDDSIPLPNIDDLDEGSTPGSFELEIPITIMTKIGFNMEQAKINNYGEITENVEIDMDLGPRATKAQETEEEEEEEDDD
ncbi:hypothetical protein MPK64_gp141 [Erwinia phage pEa_SNUABM_16]|uniref:Uncharacterized protein n=1 Tax=Erwinia phage pEa_SNUABM_16 TaxID=2869544 RepID=A0AAE8XPT0_9CAUD|nr:hypothetical protein MPK64_gp141 [Erwinia phage pEa_SNUABM_16]QZE59044.1 hypothetical protein pEaSNUABM18_00141 [Erwinia phage pEa_SNUABM_18]UAW96285.1 hypothetical protein pEaSNUABM16_00141 [Erwinia phage pEa_SNUABM_16]